MKTFWTFFSAQEDATAVVTYLASLALLCKKLSINQQRPAYVLHVRKTVCYEKLYKIVMSLFYLKS